MDNFFKLYRRIEGINGYMQLSFLANDFLAYTDRALKHIFRHDNVP